MFGDFNLLPEIAAALHKASSNAVKKAAFDVQAAAQTMAPVATGFLKSSIYCEFNESSTYADAGTPPGDSELLPEIERAENDTTAYVAVGANYGIYQEFGTSKMGAQPYMSPAADAVRPSFEAAMAAIEEKLRGLPGLP